MSKAMDSSFLDPKLQKNLTKSLRIQSKMRAPTGSKDPIDARKSIFTQGINLRSTRSSIMSTSDSSMIRLIKKLAENEDVLDHLSSMLDPADMQKLAQIKAAKLAKSSPEKDTSRISQRKARNLFKEDLLYSTGKKTDQAEEIDELQDHDQIVREIEDLQTEKSKLILDINKCEQFINLKSSSAYFRFHYLLTKLQFIRKCTQHGSASMLTADYFSMVLDKRKEMIESVKSEMENVQKTMDQIQSLRQQFDNEITSFVSAMDRSEEGCRSIIRDAEQAEQATFLGQLPAQQRLDMLDDKLAQIIRSFKEKVSRSVPKKSKEKEKVEVELNYDPAVAADDVVKASAENLNKFKENVGATMQRCFQHIEGRLLRMQASRRALMEDNAVPNSERIVESAKEIHVNLASREDSLSRMVTLENSLRHSAEQAFEDRTRSLLSAVAQSEQASIGHLKAHYHNLYAKSPSRVRRRSTLLL